ncbi:AraC family transcriptional regulator [Trinickia violacea]|uniref:AraC family transcriptional regulator n=1 Tax=Trinickia violacea TaxID=2571746 RepID=A0A4P8J1H5_9BURK|nr:AraC family transcriptional regulator [Trinickia violacea]QCP54707.1 AraC family transcriptional regulator [Trinickia violacea]
MADHVQYQHIAEVPGLVLGAARFSEFSFDLHFHLDYHIGLVTEGVQRQRFGGKTVLLGPGCVSLMPPGEIHDGTREGGGAFTLQTFRLSPDLLDNMAEEIGGSPREPELAGIVLEDPVLAGHLLRLHDAMRRNDGAITLDVQSQWLTLMECLFRQSRAVVRQDVKGALSPMQWQRVKDYCFAHLGEKITLDELASVCGLGRFHFLRQFKQTVGMTPHAWLVRLRLEQACALLARSAHTIAEVAQGVGFYDQSHFNRAFRQAFGVPPSNY